MAVFRTGERELKIVVPCERTLFRVAEWHIREMKRIVEPRLPTQSAAMSRDRCGLGIIFQETAVILRDKSHAFR
jgi:hypothetical protein